MTAQQEGRRLRSFFRSERPRLARALDRVKATPAWAAMAPQARANWEANVLIRDLPPQRDWPVMPEDAQCYREHAIAETANAIAHARALTRVEAGEAVLPRPATEAAERRARAVRKQGEAVLRRAEAFARRETALTTHVVDRIPAKAAARMEAGLQHRPTEPRSSLGQVVPEMVVVTEADVVEATSRVRGHTGVPWGLIAVGLGAIGLGWMFWRRRPA